MLSLLVSAALSFLPKRYRDRLPAIERLDLRQGAVVSGLLQFLVCLLIFLVRYPSFLRQRVQGFGEAAIRRGAEEALASEAVQFGMGYVSMVEYVFHPLSLLLIYFVAEGAVRMYAAVITQEIVGTLPLHAVAWAEEGLRRTYAERALGPRVPDMVERIQAADYQLRIASCRRKTSWGRLTSVAYEGRFYHVVAERRGSPPHRFIYQLREIPPGWTIRGIHHYDAREVLPKEEGESALASRLATWLRQRLRRAGREQPWVPDIVQRVSSQDYELRVASSRRKPAWDYLMTVEYEGELFEVVGEQRASPPHPYVYLLRKFPPGKVIRGFQHYRPDEPPTEQ